MSDDGVARLEPWRRFGDSTFKAVGDVHLLGWDPSGEVLHLTLLGKEVPHVEGWNVRTGERLPPTPLTRDAPDARPGSHPFAVSPDGALSVTRVFPRGSGPDNHLAVSRADGTLVATLASSHWATAPEFSRDGRRVIAGHGGIACWDAATGERLWHVAPHNHGASKVCAVARAVDGEGFFVIDIGLRLCAVSDDGVVRWRAALPPVGTPSDDWRRLQLLPSPDGRSLAVGIDQRPPRILDAATGVDRTPAVGHRGLLSRLAVSPDGRLAASADDEREVRVYDLDDDDPRWTLEVEGGVGGLAFSRDGRSLWTAGLDGNVRRWSLATGMEEASRPVWPHAPAQDVVAAADGARLLVACGVRFEWRLQLWGDRHTTPALWSQRMKDAVRVEAAFSDAESRVVVATFDRVYNENLWSLAALDAATGREVAEPETSPGFFLGLCPTDHGPLSAVRVDDRLELREAFGARREVAAREASAAVSEVAVSADGRWMALADAGCVELWSLAATARCVARVRPAGELDSVAALALSHDGGLLVVGTRCGVVAVYARTECAVAPTG